MVAFHGPSYFSYFSYLGSPLATAWIAALLADLHVCVCRRFVCYGALVFRHLSIQLEFRYLGMNDIPLHSSRSTADY